MAERIRRPEPAGLIYLVAIRFLFIPFFLFCNYIPDRRTWPVLIQSDYVYILGSASLAFSNGYASSLAMMYAPKCVPQQYAPISGMMASAAVIIGKHYIFTIITLSHHSSLIFNRHHNWSSMFHAVSSINNMNNYFSIINLDIDIFNDI